MFKAVREGDEIVIRVPIRKEPSKTGKTTLVASTHGNKESDLVVDGERVVVAVNCYIKRR